jgi:hypothetical protein
VAALRAGWTVSTHPTERTETEITRTAIAVDE